MLTMSNNYFIKPENALKRANGAWPAGSPRPYPRLRRLPPLPGTRETPPLLSPKDNKGPCASTNGSERGGNERQTLLLTDGFLQRSLHSDRDPPLLLACLAIARLVAWLH